MSPPFKSIKSPSVNSCASTMHGVVGHSCTAAGTREELPPAVSCGHGASLCSRALLATCLSAWLAFRALQNQDCVRALATPRLLKRALLRHDELPPGPHLISICGVKANAEGANEAEHTGNRQASTGYTKKKNAKMATTRRNPSQNELD